MPLQDFTSANSSPAPSLDPIIQEQLSHIINDAILEDSGKSPIAEINENYGPGPSGWCRKSGLLESEIVDEDDDDSVKDKNYETESSDSFSEDGSTIALQSSKKRKRYDSNGLDTTSDRNGKVLEQEAQQGKIKQRGRKGETRQVRQNRNRMRNLGKEYSTLKGKVIPERRCKDLQSCRLKCQERIKDEERNTIFSDYWSMENYDKRVAFMANLITTKEKNSTRAKKHDKKHKNRCVSHTYGLRINGQMVKICKKCFLLTFGESTKFITTVINKKEASLSGITAEDGRGKGASYHKLSMETLDLVRKHISELPAYESHYCRKQTENKFLPHYYTLSRIYEEYKNWIPKTVKPVSRRIYESAFHSAKIKIKNPKKDSCAKCDKLTMQIKNTSDLDAKQALENDLNNHQKDAEDAFESKRIDIKKTVDEKSKSVLAFDLQQCLPTPDIQTSIVFYKRQLWTFNLTVHRCEDKQAFCYMWDETTAARGANQIASCLYKYLQHNVDPEIKTLTFYSDTCAGQNKNSYLPVMFMLLLQKNPNLQQIDHKFLEPGHTHMECDTDHSIIEKKKKKHEAAIEHPRDWMQLVRMCGKTKPFKVIEMERKDFFEFSALLKTYLINKKTNEAGEQVVWRQIKWIRYSSDHFGIVQYKTSLLQEDAAFMKIDFRRKAKTSIPTNVKPPLSYKGPVPINTKKKDNLLELLPYINKNFHQFYQNIVTKDNIPNIIPLSDDESE